MFRLFKIQSRFVRNVAILLSGSAIAQLVPILVSPILSRLYSPEDFGLYGVFVALVGVCCSVLSLSYEKAILLPGDARDAGILVVLSFTISVAMIVVFSVGAVLLFAFNVFDGNSAEQIEGVLPIAILSTLMIGMFNIIVNYANRIGAYSAIASATALKSGVQSSIQVLLAGSPLGLIIGQLVSVFFANGRILVNVFRGVKVVFPVKLKELVQIGFEYRNFPKFTAPHVLLNTASSYLPVLILAPYFGVEVAGFYTLAVAVVQTPMVILGGALSRVFNQNLIERKKNGEDLVDFTYSILIGVVKALFIPLTIFVALSPQIFVLAFGDSWSQSGEIVQVVMPWFIGVMLISIISFIPNLFGQQKKALYIEILYFVIKLVSLLGGSYMGDLMLTLAVYSSISCLVLLYNFRWFMSLLKEG